MLLGGPWTLGTLSLLSQERTSKGQLIDQWRMLRDRPQPHAVFLRGIRDYMRPDFHPLQADVDRLADEYIASVGMAQA
jgi:predicted metal-dependent hydrolase